MSISDKIVVQGPLLCIDEMLPDGRTRIERETIEQVRLRYPGAEVADFKTWLAAKEKALCTEPEEISRDKWWEMLEVLPPQRWQRGHDCESFELMEHTSGRVTAIYVRIGEKYYEFQGIMGQSLAAHATNCNPEANRVAVALAKAFDGK